MPKDRSFDCSCVSHKLLGHICNLGLASVVEGRTESLTLNVSLPLQETSDCCLHIDSGEFQEWDPPSFYLSHVLLQSEIVQILLITPHHKIYITGSPPPLE